ncbi:MAG: RNA polymerase sigma factor region1.1 domain-containing protein, partial [Pseudomonadota bacterium]|nr:RNA polymerase sigma factor region1.1 domain-containing protein [Pseudomonadota bacterium]
MVNKRKKNKKSTQNNNTDSALLDMNNRSVKKMIKSAKSVGYVTYEELNKVISSEEFSSEQIEDVMSMLSEMGINVIENEEEEQEQASEVVATKKAATERADRTDDPVRMYLREMGSVDLLSREGEIAIAKRIEAGKEAMIEGLCESPLTFQAIIIWRDELNDGQVLLRDI